MVKILIICGLLYLIGVIATECYQAYKKKESIAAKIVGLLILIACLVKEMVSTA